VLRRGSRHQRLLFGVHQHVYSGLRVARGRTRGRSNERVDRDVSRNYDCGRAGHMPYAARPTDGDGDTEFMPGCADGDGVRGREYGCGWEYGEFPLVQIGKESGF
jgi:hypothetical protein